MHTEHVEEKKGYIYRACRGIIRSQRIISVVVINLHIIQ